MPWTYHFSLVTERESIDPLGVQACASTLDLGQSTKGGDNLLAKTRRVWQQRHQTCFVVEYH
jgi:hypothetical protein